MSSAIYFSFDQSKISSSGNRLNACSVRLIQAGCCIGKWSLKAEYCLIQVVSNTGLTVFENIFM